MRRLASYTAADFDAEFRNDDTCLHCAKCGQRWKHHRVTDRTAHACAVEGVERLEGRDVYKLKPTMKRGQVRHLWVDAVSLLYVKVGGTPKLMDGKMRLWKSTIAITGA